MKTIFVFVIEVLKGIAAGPLVLVFQLWKMVVTACVKIFKRGDFGQIVNHIGTLLTLSNASDPVQNKISICSHLSLDGSLSLEQLRLLFEEKVLECRFPCGKNRYPELTQFPVSFGGYQFWRSDPSFRIENHVRERVYGPGEEIPTQQELFAEVLNLPFPKGQSPWECLLLKGGGGGGGENKGNHHCVLLLRMHHIMGDARSMVKLVVEALGGTELKTAKCQQTLIQKISPLVEAFVTASLLPFHLINLLRRVALAKRHSENHPWMIPDISKDSSPFIVASSRKLLLEDLKAAGHTAGIGNTSAVIMAIISGAIRRMFVDKRAADADALNGGGTGTPVAWTLPKANHPPTLANHMYSGLPFLPTHVEERPERLRQCGQVYRQSRFSQSGALVDFGGFLLSGVVTPLLGLFSHVGDVVPVAVTNIAGHSEGLWIGGVECSGFNFCVNIPTGSIGVLFVVFSYKDSVQINVVAKSSILSPTDLSKLTELVEMEAAELCGYNCP